MSRGLPSPWHLSGNATYRELIGINALPAVESHGCTVETPRLRWEPSLGALDEHIDVGGDFDGDTVDLQVTVSPLSDGGARGVGEDRVTGADADG